MAKSHGGVVGRGLSDSLVVQFSLNQVRVGEDELVDFDKTYGDSTNAEPLCVGFHGSVQTTSVTSARQTVFTVPMNAHLDKIVICGRTENTSTVASTFITNPSGEDSYKDPSSSSLTHGDQGMNIRVRKSPIASMRTFVQIVDNSINGSDVVDYIRCPTSGGQTIVNPFAITYTGQPQVRGAGVGWTGSATETRIDDFVVGDRIQLTVQSSDSAQSCEHLYAFAVFSLRD